MNVETAIHAHFRESTQDGHVVLGKCGHKEDSSAINAGCVEIAFIFGVFVD